MRFNLGLVLLLLCLCSSALSAAQKYACPDDDSGWADACNFMTGWGALSVCCLSLALMIVSPFLKTVGR